MAIGQYQRLAETRSLFKELQLVMISENLYSQIVASLQFYQILGAATDGRPMHEVEEKETFIKSIVKTNLAA
jgi:hypothetical protein